MLFRLHGGVTVPPWATFPGAPQRSRTVGFPESGSDLGMSFRGLPTGKEAHMLAHERPLTCGLLTDLVPFLRARLPRLNVRDPPRDRQVSRAPLHAAGVTRSAAASCTASLGVTPASSLLRAHAPDQMPPADFVYLIRRVFAGCRQSLLADGPSRR